MATITYTVTVASGTNQYGTGNKFLINGEVSPVLYLQEGNTYILINPILVTLRVELIF